MTSTTVIATQRKFLGVVVKANENDSVVCSGDDTGKSKFSNASSDDRFRKILVKSGVLDSAIGSAYIEFGDTKVICAVNSPKELNNGDAQKGNLNVIVNGIEQSARHSIHTALSAVVCLKKIARAEVDIEVNVLADDGGALAVSIMAASLALVSANIECFDIIVAVHFLLYNDGKIILDPETEKIVAERLKIHKCFQVNTTNDEIEVCNDDLPINDFLSVTIAVAPSLGQIVFVDASNGSVRKGVVKDSLKYGFEKCLELYPVVSKNLHNLALRLV